MRTLHGLRIGINGTRTLYDYEVDPEHPSASQVSNISPYLVEGKDTVVLPVRHPLSDAPDMVYGSFALDDGNYTLSQEDREAILRECPEAAPYIRPFVGGKELLYNEQRYCLWLKDAEPSSLRRMPAVIRRVDAVRRWRSGRNRNTTRQLADTPTQFAEIRQPEKPCLAIPTLSSERRPYIPIGMLPETVIASNQIYVLPGAKLWHFGVLHSSMHMAWVRGVCGRLESRYRYSNAIVYNNFPWPSEATDAQRQKVEGAAQGVLEARGQYPEATLADLYNPNAMPPALRRAHEALDRAVDRAYRAQPFGSERQRLEYLFSLYQRLIAPLTAGGRRVRGRG